MEGDTEHSGFSKWEHVETGHGLTVVKPPPEYRDGMPLFSSECWASDLDDADELEFCEAMQVKDMYFFNEDLTADYEEHNFHHLLC